MKLKKGDICIVTKEIVYDDFGKKAFIEGDIVEVTGHDTPTMFPIQVKGYRRNKFGFAASELEKIGNINDVEEEEFWAIFIRYNPWSMGGECTRTLRFKLTGDPAKVGKYNCHIAKFLGGWRVYEDKTGGLLGHAKTRAGAIKCALRNIKETPDLDAQMKYSGDVMKHASISTKQAEKDLKED